MFHRTKVLLRNLEIRDQELKSKEKQIKDLTEKLKIIQHANHKILHRFEALEYKVAQQSNTEFSDDFSITIEDIQKLQKEYQDDSSQIKGETPLPFTKIKELDNLFAHFANKFADNNIEFTLTISGSIPYMVDHIIEQNKLETMIGDHLQDALNAVNSSCNPFRKVLAGIGLVNDCYEFKVYDSGIPFEVDTLIQLGTAHVTTRSDAGGSGIGFMTTFDTMREYGASLIINEKPLSNFEFSKSVTIRFDSKNQYIIETYRPDEFPTENRYIIVSRK